MILKIKATAWSILVRHPMWKGWRPLVSMYGCSLDEALDEARRAKIYYEGAIKTKVVPMKQSKQKVSIP